MMDERKFTLPDIKESGGKFGQGRLQSNICGEPAESLVPENELW